MNPVDQVLAEIALATRRLEIEQDLTQGLLDFKRRQAICKAAASAARYDKIGRLKPRPKPNNQHLHELAIDREHFEDVEFWVAYSPLHDDYERLKAIGIPFPSQVLDPFALNGYVAFRKRNAPRALRGGLLHYIPGMPNNVSGTAAGR